MRGILFSILFLFSLNIFASQKIGIMMGTFDPPHIGHLNIIETAIMDADLDKVIIIPNFNAAHKPNATDIEHRMAMTRIFFAGKNKLEVISQSEFQYLQTLKAIFGTNSTYEYFLENSTENQQYFQITGSDALLRYQYHTAALYINNDRLDLLVSQRPDEGEFTSTHVEGAKHKIQLLSNPSLKISSTELRKAISENANNLSSIEENIGTEVLNYIKLTKLYMSDCSQALMN